MTFSRFSSQLVGRMRLIRPFHLRNFGQNARMMSTIPPKKSAWQKYEEKSAIMAPVIIVSIIGWLTYQHRISKEVESAKEHISDTYPIDMDELLQLRETNRMTCKHVMDIHYQLVQDYEELEKVAFTAEEFMVVVEKQLKQSFHRRFLFERLFRHLVLEYETHFDIEMHEINNTQPSTEKKSQDTPVDLENASLIDQRTLPALECLTLLSMITFASTAERSALVFYLWDEDQDGHISISKFQRLFWNLLRMGWCYDKRLYKQSGLSIHIVPTSQIIKNWMNEHRAHLASKDAAFTKLETISWSQFADLKLRLV